MKFSTVRRSSSSSSFASSPFASSFRPVFGLIGVGIVLTVLLGCSKPAVVGEWETSKSGNVMGVQATAQIHASIKPDGKYAITQNVQARGQSVMTSQEEGTWEVKGENITLASNTHLLNGVPVGQNTETRKTQKYKVNGDRLTFNTGEADEVTLKRVKN